MSTVLHIEDRTQEAQNGLERIASLLEKAAASEESLLQAVQETSKGLDLQTQIANALETSLGKLDARIKKVSASIEKSSAVLIKQAEASKNLDTALEKTGERADSFSEKIRSIATESKAMGDSLKGAGKDVSTAGAAIDRGTETRTRARRATRELSEEERRLQEEQKNLSKAHNASLTPLLRLMERKKELLAIESQEIKSSQKYADTKRLLDAQIGRAFRRQEIQDGRTLSEQLDGIVNRMTMIPGPIGRVGASLGTANTAIAAFTGGGASAATAAGAAADGIGAVGFAANAGTIAIGAIAGSALLLGGGLIAAGIHSAKFTQELRVLQNVSGATDAEMKMLHDTALQVAAATQFTPTQAVEGLQNLASLGFNARESMSMLRPVMDLAAAGSLGVGEAASIAGAALLGYGIPVDQAGIALDKLAKIGNMTGIQFNDLTAAISKSGVAHSLANQSLDEMLVTMGLARNTALSMEEVATGSTSALVNMSTVGRKRMDDLKISIKDANGNFRAFGDILLDVDAKTKGFTDPDRVKMLHDIFGTFGDKAVVPMMKQLSDGITTTSGEILKGAEALEYLRTSIKNADGTLKSFVDNKMDTLAGQVTLFGGAWDTLVTTIGEVVEPALKHVVEYGVANINALISVVGTLKDAWQNVFGDKRTLSALKGDLEAIERQIDLIDPTRLTNTMQSSAVGAEKLEKQLKFLNDEMERINALQSAGVDVGDRFRETASQISRVSSRIRELKAGASELSRQKVRIEVDPTTAKRLEELQQKAKELRDEIALQDKASKPKGEEKPAQPKVDAPDDSKKRAAESRAKREREEALKFIEQWTKETAKAEAEVAGGIARLQMEEAEALRQLAADRVKAVEGVKGNKQLEERIEVAYLERRDSINQVYAKKIADEREKEAERKQKELDAEAKRYQQFQKELIALTREGSKGKIEQVEWEAQEKIQHIEQEKYTEEQKAQLIVGVESWKQGKIKDLRDEAAKNVNALVISDVDKARAEADAKIKVYKDMLDQRLIDEKQFQVAKNAIEQQYNMAVFQQQLDQVSKYAEYAQRFASLIGSYFEEKMNAHVELGEKTAEEIKEIDDKLANAEFEQEKISLQAKRETLEAKLQAEKDAARKSFVGQQIAAVGEAAIQGAISLMKLTAMYPPVVPTLAMWGIGAGLIAAETAFAVGKITSQKPPTFHRGVAGLAPDEMMARVQKKESILTPTATDIMGTRAINDMNGGATMRGQNQRQVQRLEFNRTFVDILLRDATERRGPLRTYVPNDRVRFGMR